MKVITVADAKDRLPEIIAEANSGERIILRSGDQEVTLYAGTYLNPELDGPELEAELLKSVDEPATPYSSEEFRAIGREILKKYSKE